MSDSKLTVPASTRRRKDTPKPVHVPQFNFQEMVREGDMFKLHIEERDEDSSSDDDENDGAAKGASAITTTPQIQLPDPDLVPKQPFIRRKKSSHSDPHIQVIETEFAIPRRPSIMKQGSSASLDVPQPKLEKRNSVVFDDDHTVLIPSAAAPAQSDSESDEDNTETASEDEDAVNVSKLVNAYGTLKIRKGLDDGRGEKGRKREPKSEPTTPPPTPMGTPAPPSYMELR